MTVRRRLGARLLGALALVVATLPLAGVPLSPATAATTVTVGADLSASGPPTQDCGAQTCNVLQAEGPGRTLVTATGTAKKLRVRHGAVASGGALMSTDVAVVVLTRSGSSYTVVRVGAAGSLPVSTDPDRVTELPVNLPVQAGQYLALRVSSAWAGSEVDVIGAGSSGDVAAVRSDNHQSGTLTYSDKPALQALFSVDIEAGDAGGGDPGTGDPGTGDPSTGDPGTDDPGTGDPGTGDPGTGTPGDACTPAPFPPKKIRGKATRAGGRGNWTGQVVGKQDNFNDVRLRYDAKGRTHTAGRGVFHQGVYYYGPGGSWQLDSSQTEGSVGLAMDRKGRPVVAWGATKPSSGRVIEYCPQLYLTQVGRTPQVVRRLPAGSSGFYYVDLAGDRRTGKLHLAYEVGNRLTYQLVGGRPERLGVTGVREVRIAAGGGTVAVAARTAQGGLTVLARKGTGAFKKVVGASGIQDFDLAVSPTGRLSAAWSAGAVPKLSVYNGKRVVRTRFKAETVGVAALGDRTHVAFSLRGAPACWWFYGCAGNGIYHLTLQGSRGRLSTVQGSVGYSPSRLSVDVVGRRVGIAYGNPADSGHLTVRSRRV